MKKCIKGSSCKTAPNRAIANSNFEKTHGKSGGLRKECRKCRGRYNGLAPKEGERSEMMYFMAALAWVPSNQVKINDRVSQLRLL